MPRAGSCSLAVLEPCVLHIATPDTGSCAQLRMGHGEWGGDGVANPLNQDSSLCVICTNFLCNCVPVCVPHV